MTNILHLHSSSGLYGAESVIINLSKALDALGYHPIIGSIEVDARSLSAFARQAIEKKLDTEILVSRVKFSPIAIFKIANLVREREIQIIHSHYNKATVLGYFASRIAGIPLIETNHLFPPMPLSDRKLQLYAKIGACFLRYAEKTVAVSNEIKGRLERRGVPGAKISVIKNGIDDEECEAAYLSKRIITRRELGIKEASLIIGAVGRVTEQKGFEYLLQAAKNILTTRKNILFVVAGDGERKEEFINYTHACGIEKHFLFLGFRSDILSILAAMDIFVMPSIHEGLPMALLEAMAMKVPVIVTPVGEIPEVIRDGVNGLLVQPRDAEALADKIIYLIENDSVRSRIKENAFQTVKKHHSKETMSRNYALVYDEIINNISKGYREKK
jgi:glycosyltransferase involved in cell wall biosynthesis